MQNWYAYKFYLKIMTYVIVLVSKYKRKKLFRSNFYTSIILY